MAHYETTYIIDPGTTEEAVNGIAEKYSQQVTSQGGEVLNVEHWGKRKLAYEIKGRTEGFYVNMRFNSTPAVAQELERVLKISDEIVRNLLIKLN